MPAILQELFGKQSESINKIIKSTGEPRDRSLDTISICSALLIGALAREANHSRRKAEAIASTLQKESTHQLFQDRTGERILNTVFGHMTGEVEKGISDAISINNEKVHRILITLAPALIIALSKIARAYDYDPDRIASLLNRERAEIEQAQILPRGSLLDFLQSSVETEVSSAVKRLAPGLNGLIRYYPEPEHEI